MTAKVHKYPFTSMCAARLNYWPVEPLRLSASLRPRIKYKDVGILYLTSPFSLTYSTAIPETFISDFAEYFARTAYRVKIGERSSISITRHW
jgi:hypothetical protein